MPIFRSFLLAFSFLTVSTSILLAAGDMLQREPEVPSGLQFVRRLDVDGYVQSTNQKGLGAQTLRVRTRYLDPDVNAFVGLVTGASHFNQDLRIGNPAAPDTAGILWNWGADVGIVRGKHLWELDLMGTTLSRRLGYAMAVVGEHRLTDRMPGIGNTGALILYHRTEVNVFTRDAILDADQGVYWMWSRQAGFSVGYRWMTSQHMDRSGPHVGVRLLFENPKIPFIFPSLG